MDDLQLLENYAEARSEPAFTELVQRHVDLVYSTALRLVGDRPLAEDVTQMVFIRLARKAGSLRHGTILTGWLYRTTRFVAETVRRSDWRRRQRETLAMQLTQLDQSSESVWNEVSPLLERAMAGLRQGDQDAVLLRFFAGKSLREVGDSLGISDDAAQKRVDRALGRMREYFARRGVAVSAMLLAPMLAGHAVQAAPVSVATVLAASTAGAGSATLSVTAFDLLKAVFIGKLKASAASGIVATVLLFGGAFIAVGLLTDSNKPAQAAAPAARTLRGKVQTPDGKPLPGALVRVATPDAYIRLYEITNAPAITATNQLAGVSNRVASLPRNTPAASAITALDGSFVLDLPTEPREGRAVVVVNHDTGYAIITADQLSLDPDLVAQPWGRIEGVLRIGKTLATNHAVNISIWGSGPIYEWNLVSHWLSVKTDARGRFVFPRVAPTDVWLTHDVMVRPGDERVSGHHHVRVGPGDKIQVQLGGRGRVVTGRIDWTADDKLVFYGSMWANQKHWMRDPTGWRTMTTEQRRQYELAWRDTEEGELFKEEVRNYEFPVQPDGTFRVPDVLPGSYRMQVRADAPREAGKSARHAAVVETKVIVPEISGDEAEEPLDIGTLMPAPARPGLRAK